MLLVAALGAMFILFAWVNGKEDLATDLPYDLGIACLIIAGIEFGLQRGLKRLSSLLPVSEEARYEREYRDFIYLMEMVMENENFSEEVRDEVREQMSLLKYFKAENDRKKVRSDL